MFKHFITAADGFVVGDTLELAYTIYQRDRRTPQNVAGWTFLWELLRADTLAVVLSKTSGAGVEIAGVYSAVADNNTQRIVVTVNETDTAPFTVLDYIHRIRRNDAGFKRRLSHGEAKLIV